MQHCDLLRLRYVRICPQTSLLHQDHQSLWVARVEVKIRATGPYKSAHWTSEIRRRATETSSRGRTIQAGERTRNSPSELKYATKIRELLRGKGRRAQCPLKTYFTSYSWLASPGRSLHPDYWTCSEILAYLVVSLTSELDEPGYRE